MSRTNFSNTNLTEAQFNQAILTRASFNHACLNSANFKSAVLIEADFSDASLLGANFAETDLSHTNFAGASYNSQTIFPNNFDPVSKGMINRCTVQELLAQLNKICQHSSKYLGDTMTSKYLLSSRPNSEWLRKFVINRNSQVSFSGNSVKIPTEKEIKLFQQWQNYFIKSCSVIIKDFKTLV